jgi:alanine racemase
MMQPNHSQRCWVEVDLSALRHNAEVALQHSGGSLMAVVKANAYGHGAVEVARALGDKATMLGVANLHEAEELRAGGITATILLLSPCLPAEFGDVVANEFHVSVSSLAEAQNWSDLARSQGGVAHVHAVLDTGMGRMGFTDAQWDATTIKGLLALPNVRWEGLASHLPSPDEDADFTRHQIGQFQAAANLAKSCGFHPRWLHLSNSAGLLGYEETRLLCNLSRPGLMLYGVSPLPEWSASLKPALQWKTRITLVRELPAGHGISYGRSFVTQRPTRVATLACGYADGYPRQVSGHGARVLISGHSCPVLGRVTMDQMMLDVTDLPLLPEPGAEAILLGRQDGSSVTAEEIAKLAGTIPWHVLTGIGARVERVYLRA